MLFIAAGAAAYAGSAWLCGLFAVVGVAIGVHALTKR